MMKTGIQLLTIIFLITTGRLFAQDVLALAFPVDTKKTSSTTSRLPAFEFRASTYEYDLSLISNFNFTQFYEKLHQCGQVIYQGKLSDTNCFKIGNIGQLYLEDIENLLTAIKEVLKEIKQSNLIATKFLYIPHSKDSKIPEGQFS